VTSATLAARAILAAVPLVGIACGSREVSVTAPSVPGTFILAKYRKDDRAVGVQPFIVGADGRLTASAPDVIVSSRSSGPFVDVRRRVVYFVDAEAGRLLAYRIDPSTGGLALFGQADVPQPFGQAAVDPTRGFLYTTGSGSLFGYRIETSGGLSVEPLPESPFTTSSNHGYPIVRDLTLSPSGRFLWVHAEQSTGSFGYPRRTQEALLSFRVSPERGTVEPTGQLDIKVYDGDRSNLSVDPREKFAFLGRRDWNRRSTEVVLTTYGIDPESGALVEVGELRPSFALKLYATPSGRWLLADSTEHAAGLRTMEIQPQGSLVRRNALQLEKDAEDFVQHGPHVFASLDWATRDGHHLGARLLTLRLDEATGGLEVVRDLELPEIWTPSLTLADLTAD
jgi:6-phosphogluconolactonase (cycloisomerase 2 family)